MATYKNITGRLLIVSDELGNTIGFDPDETKENLSNYLENYTSSKITTPEDVLLRRIGDLDPDRRPEFGGEFIAGLEDENIAVQPGQPTQPTLGMDWGQVGGLHGDDPNAEISTSFLDPSTNVSNRKNKVIFDPQFEKRSSPARRKSESTNLGIRPLSEVISSNAALFRKSEVIGPEAFSDNAPATEIEFMTKVTKISDSPLVATQLDLDNPIYGSLLVLGQEYDAWGSVRVFDDSEGTYENIGFRVDVGTTIPDGDPLPPNPPGNVIFTKVPDAFTGFSALAFDTVRILMIPFGGMVPFDVTGFTFVRSGGEAADTLTMEAVYVTGAGGAAIIDIFFEPGEIMGFYTDLAVTPTGAGDEALIIPLSNGIMQFGKGLPPALIPYGTSDAIIP